MAGQAYAVATGQAPSKRNAEVMAVEQVMRWRSEVSRFAPDRLEEFDELIADALNNPAPRAEGRTVKGGAGELVAVDGQVSDTAATPLPQEPTTMKATPRPGGRRSLTVASTSRTGTGRGQPRRDDGKAHSEEREGRRWDKIKGPGDDTAEVLERPATAP